MKLFKPAIVFVLAITTFLSCISSDDGEATDNTNQQKPNEPVIETPLQNTIVEPSQNIKDNEVTTSKTLLDASGKRIRATPIAVGKEDFLKSTVAFGMQKSNWELLKKRGFNAVRICWVDPWAERRGYKHWSAEEVLPVLDTYIKNASETGMNVIINYHNVAEYQAIKDIKTSTGTRDLPPENFNDMKTFWKVIASRYKDNKLVFYEINNEQVWNEAAYMSEEYKSNTKVVYDQIRRDAPERQIILFSFHSLALDMKLIVDDYDWIDWKYTSVGWHLYGFGKNPSVEKEEENMRNLINNYRNICTEWGWNVDGAASYVKTYFNTLYNTQGLEENQISWANWHDWADSSSPYFQTMINDAKEKNYWWAKN